MDASDQPSSTPAVASASRGLRGLLLTGVIAATLVAFLPVLGNDFVSLDDHKNFLANYHYRGLGIENIRWAITTFHNGAYQPLSWILFSTEYVLWGLNPYAYHGVSLLIQCLNAVLFYWLARRLLIAALPRAASQYPSVLACSAALSALLFSLHPLRVEAVAWLSTQPYLSVGLFYLLSLLAYLRACEHRDERRARLVWLGISCLCYGASILSKGVGIGLVAVLLILDVYPLRRLWLRSTENSLREPVSYILLEKVPYLVFTLASAMLAVRSKVEAMVPVASYDLPHRFVQACWGLMFYLAKTLWPTGLSPWYQFPDGFSIWESRFVLSVILVFALTIAAIALRRRLPALAALWAYYVVVILPLSHLVRIGRQAAADRYTYVSCMGWAILGGAGLLIAWDAYAQKRLKKEVLAGIIAIALGYCLFLGVMSWRQCMVWRDGMSVWARAVEVSPNISVPHNNLAMEYRARGDQAAAARHTRRAIELDPNDVTARINWSSVCLESGRPDLALEQLDKSLRLEPNEPRIRGALGGVYLSLGRYAEAADNLQQAAGSRPNDETIRCNLATALMRLKRYDEAIVQCREALRISPDMSTAVGLWGSILIARGDVDAGIERLIAALHMDPASGNTRLNLTRALTHRGRTNEAMNLLRAGAELDKPDPRVIIELIRQLLTCPQADLRNPPEALRRAEDLNRQTAGRNPDVLEALATALTANGARDQAIAILTQAADEARRQNRPAIAERLSQAAQALRSGSL